MGDQKRKEARETGEEHARESSEELAREERKRAREEKREKDHDILAKEEPNVLASSEYDPEFPALEEFEVDEGGAPGSKRKHPGLIWAVIAIVAVAVLIAAYVFTGGWFTPDQAQQEAQRQFDEQVIPEDMGEN